MPTIFKFAPKRVRESSEQRIAAAEKRQFLDDLLDDTAIVMETETSSVIGIDSAAGTNEMESTAAPDDTVQFLSKGVGTVQVKHKSKGVGNHVKLKTRASQVNLSSLALENGDHRGIGANQKLRVKLFHPKPRDTTVNTELSFPPDASVLFTMVSDDKDNLNDSVISDRGIKTDTESDEESAEFSTSTDSSDDNQDSTQPIECSLSDPISPVTEPKFIVFWSCLMSLFNVCSACFSKNIITSVQTKGTLLIVKTTCVRNHMNIWRSQPSQNHMPAGNVLLAAGILYSGNTFSRISELLSYINIAHISETTYVSIQKPLLFPVLNLFYKSESSKIIGPCHQSDEHDFSGDGRSDSPGYSAKYGTYSLMHTSLNKIVDFFVVHVNWAGNSSRMEKYGLEKLLQKFTDGSIKISSLTTDRHVQIKSFLKKERPDILHQFDVWHFGKSIKKALSAHAKKKRCANLSLWIKSVVNHFWWCSASSIGNEILMKEKWLSLLNHVQNIHSWAGNAQFHQCEHGEIEKRKWLNAGSCEFEALEEVVNNQKTLSDLKYLVNFFHTGNLEVFTHCF